MKGKLEREENVREGRAGPHALLGGSMEAGAWLLCRGPARIPFCSYLELSLSSKVAKETFNTETHGKQDLPTPDLLMGKPDAYG